MAWQQISVTDAGLNQDKLTALEKAIAAEDFKLLQSILIVRDGKLAYEKYFQDTDDTHQHNVRSASKAITSTAIGIAIAEGHIPSPQDLVYPYFAEVYDSYANWHDTEKHSLTIHDLLTMTSCLECDDWNEYSQGNEERMYLIKDWVKFTLDLPVRGVRWHPSHGDAPPIYEFSYSTGGIVVLGALLEQATGMTFGDYVDLHVFQPLGITDYEWSYTPQKRVMTGGGLNTRPRDMATYGYLYLQKGMWQGQQLITPDWIEKSFANHAEIDDEQTFGYLWWRRSFTLNKHTIQSYYAAGNGGQTIWVIPELDMVAVMTSTAYGTRYGNGQPVRILQKYILPALGL